MHSSTVGGVNCFLGGPTNVLCDDDWLITGGVDE